MTRTNDSVFTRRTMLRGMAATAGAIGYGSALTGCGTGSAPGAVGSNLADITKLAKKEGKLQLIAYPKTWANYGGSFKAFTAKYGIEISVANPDGSSAEEVTAMKTLKGQSTSPDVVDIGYTFTDQVISEKLVQKYKPSNWDTIPTKLKDPNAWWVAAYYGAMSIGTNTNVVPAPTKMTDLLDSKYKGKVVLDGDPRTGASSLAAVFAAAMANGGSVGDIQPGIDFFAELAKRGNLVTTTGIASALSTGQAAVGLDWNYNFFGIKPQLEKSGVALKTVVPSDAVFGNYYAQPIVIDCPHPNAARLWVDWLTSDEGSEQYALGAAVPARIADLTKTGKLSKKAVASLPTAEVLANIVFPTRAEGAKGTKLVVDEWGPKVANQ